MQIAQSADQGAVYFSRLIIRSFVNRYQGALRGSVYKWIPKESENYSRASRPYNRIRYGLEKPYKTFGTISLSHIIHINERNA